MVGIHRVTVATVWAGVKTRIAVTQLCFVGPLVRLRSHHLRFEETHFLEACDLTVRLVMKMIREVYQRGNLAGDNKRMKKMANVRAVQNTSCLVVAYLLARSLAYLLAR